MAGARGLSNDQVAGELSKMIEFIKKEAQEKAREIHIKANEEYEIDKAGLVRAETSAIDHDFELRAKKSKLDQQIVKSTIASKTRFKVLYAKEQALDDVYTASREKLIAVPSDTKKYQALLSNLVQEAVAALGEPSVLLQVREADHDVANAAAVDAAAAIKNDKNTVVNIQIGDKHLPNESSGGVIVYSEDRKIWIDNTLDERLKLVFQKSLPRIRFDLFGASSTRRFFD